MKLAILDDYLSVALKVASWSAIEQHAKISVFTEHLGDEDHTAQALADFDIVIVMRERTRFPASLLTRLPKLRLLVTTGLRNQAIAMKTARECGIDVCGTNLLGYPAFEHTWALILALVKKIPLENHSMHEGGWQKGFAGGLRGKTLGILGLGKLGSQVAKVGQAFGMETIAWSQNLTEARAEECGVAKVGKNELFSLSDVVTIHLVMSDRTRGLISARELELMKSSAYLVNTSRAPIIDETALVDALQRGIIRGAGIDVFSVEPLPADHSLRRLDNAVLTGHTGYVTEENFRLGYREAVEDVLAWISGGTIRLLN
ncbi:MAG: D-2-hydroxyacid dehydrogenase family protein [Arenicellales bacterium]|nr:D-2-hydroxyacid dehydrogenase family protein [Arenicellales bacterium]